MQDFVRVAVIETASYPWEGHVLPLNHTRISEIIPHQKQTKICVIFILLRVRKGG